MQHRAADQLHIIVPLAYGAAGRLACDGKGFGQKVVQGLAALEPFPESRGHGSQFAVAFGHHLRFQGVGRVNQGPEPLHVAVLLGTNYLFYNIA